MIKRESTCLSVFLVMKTKTRKIKTTNSTPLTFPLFTCIGSLALAYYSKNKCCVKLE